MWRWPRHFPPRRVMDMKPLLALVLATLTLAACSDVPLGKMPRPPKRPRPTALSVLAGPLDALSSCAARSWPQPAATIPPTTLAPAAWAPTAPGGPPMASAPARPATTPPPRARPKQPPVICLHGLTRNAVYFGKPGPWIAARGRRVLLRPTCAGAALGPRSRSRPAMCR